MGTAADGDPSLFPNHRWTTHLHDGLLLEVGDTVQVEASQMNAVGAGDEVMELVGSTVGNPDIADNRARLTFGFYIGDRWQFNAPLPRAYIDDTATAINPFQVLPNGFGSHVQRSVYAWDYGDLRVDTWIQYKYNGWNGVMGIENQGTQSGRCLQPSFRKLYAGLVWDGWSAAKTQGLGPSHQLGIWAYAQYTSTCDLNAPLGFTAPAALGEVTTAQLHQKDGDAIANVAELQPAVNFNPTNPMSNAVSTELLPAITDKCWRLLPTNAGNMLYAKAQGNFDAQLANATAPGGAIGDGYNASQGARAFYSHMLTPEPNMATAACQLNRCCAKAGDAAVAFQPVGTMANLNQHDLCSGFSTTVHGTDGSGRRVGNLGLSVCLMERPCPTRHPAQVRHSLCDFTKPIDTPTWAMPTTTDLNCLKLDRYDVVVTNICANDNTLGAYVPAALSAMDVIPLEQGGAVPPSFTSQAARDLETVRLEFGRLDDEFTRGTFVERDGARCYTSLDCPTNFHGEVPVFNATHQVAIGHDNSLGNTAVVVPGVVANVGVGFHVACSHPGSYTDNCVVMKVYTASATEIGVTISSGNRVAVPSGSTYTFSSSTGYVESAALTPSLAYRNPTVTSVTKYPVSDDYCAMSTEGTKTCWGYGAQFQRNWNPDLYDVRKPAFALTVQSENWTFSPPPNSGVDLDHLLTTIAASGRACVPMWIRPSAIVDGAYHPNLLNVPFVAFIVARAVDPLVDGASVRDQIRIPNPAVGEFFGLSTSHADRGTSQIITTQKNGNFKGHPSEPDNAPNDGSGYPISAPTQCALAYYPYITLGADDPSISFDETIGRMSISKLHCLVRSGNGPFQRWLDQTAEVVNAEAANPAMSALETEAAVGQLNTVDLVSTTASFQLTSDKYPKSYTNTTAASLALHPFISAQSGVSILGISLLSATQSDSTTTFPLTPQSNSLFAGSLLAKMGFELEQLLPFFGTPQGEFNRGIYNRFLGTDHHAHDKYTSMVLPFTTNGYVSGSVNVNAVQSFAGTGAGATTADHSPFAPMYNLGVMRRKAFVDQTSDSLAAVKQPAKFDYPYLVIYSNIVPTPKYIGGASGNNSLPAVAYVGRSYTTGDYCYGEASSWAYTVDQSYVLSDTTVDTRLPDGRPAALDENSAVIFKIVKAKPLPVLPVPAPPKKR